jgi:hypothetical protein
MDEQRSRDYDGLKNAAHTYQLLLENHKKSLEMLAAVMPNDEFLSHEIRQIEILLKLHDSIFERWIKK